MKINWKALAEKYKYAALLLAVGVVLMLLPTGSKRSVQDTAGETEDFSLAAMEKQMEQTIGCIQGVGRVKVMLALKNGTSLELASDGTDSERDAETKTDRQIVKLNRGSGIQEVVVTSRTYPTFQGAVVVCDGAGASAVRLAVTQAVSVLTGLSSDRISVVQWKSS